MKAIIVFSALAVLISNGVFAKPILSPSLDVIESGLTLKKSGIVGESVTFSADDFDEALGVRPSFIKIKTLPERSDGVLRLGNLAISKNQIIERESIDKITFCPQNDEVVSASFVFCNTSDEVGVRCVINMLSEKNHAPAVKNQSVSTSESVSAFKFLSASDKECDFMTFEVTEYPSHGTVRISTDSSGYFSYTPEKGFVGDDRFVYTATDSFGNRSRKAVVSVSVSARMSDVVFDDLAGHWAYDSAVKAASVGLLSGEYDQNGEYNFNPSQNVTRGDFLALALISAGKEPKIEFCGKTSFADDDEIPLNIKSYAEYARKNGIVGGYRGDDGQAVFESGRFVTRAEASVIAERILSLYGDGADTSVYCDQDEIPTWAEKAVSRLAEVGILCGTGMGRLCPSGLVTKAECAEMLCRIRDYAKK